MRTSPISFGRKIPRYQCQIKNKLTGEKTPATLYEYNCKDESDYEEVSALGRRWAFKDNIVKNMKTKHALLTYLNERSNSSFYALEANGETVGLIQVDNCNGVSNIDYITTKPRNEYKYVGRTMVACTGKEFLKKNGYNLTVATAIDDAFPFYARLGFKNFGDSIYRMNKQEVQDLISETELKTEAPILKTRA